MQLNQALIAELQMEAANTRKILSCVPTEQNTWKPHEKSMKLGNLANHIAELPGWLSMVLTTDELDLSTMNYKPTIPETPEALGAVLDKNGNNAVVALEKSLPEDFQKTWTLRNGSHVIFSMPKIAVIRSMALSHLYHHRGQLSVYLRLLEVPFPGMYGPSADDNAAAVAAAKAAEAAAAN